MMDGRLPHDLRTKIPLHEQVLDPLGDVLLETEELLGLVRRPEALAYWWTERHIQLVHDEVDDLMKKLCD